MKLYLNKKNKFPNWFHIKLGFNADVLCLVVKDILKTKVQVILTMMAAESLFLV